MAVPALGYAALAVADTWLAGQPSSKRRRARLLTKPLLMPTLMAAFHRATEPTGPPRRDRTLTRTGTLLGQGFSGLGDVALLARGERAFLGGVGSFFAGHVAYTVTFVANGRPMSDTTDRRTGLAALGAGAVLAPTMAWAAGRRSPRLRGPVGAYATMISAMVASSTRLSDQVPPAARRTITSGAGLFMVSDSAIAIRKFWLRDPQPRSDGFVMATYTTGQGLIALGLAQAVRAPRPATAAPPARVEETGG